MPRSSKKARIVSTVEGKSMEASAEKTIQTPELVSNTKQASTPGDVKGFFKPTSGKKMPKRRQIGPGSAEDEEVTFNFEAKNTKKTAKRGRIEDVEEVESTSEKNVKRFQTTGKENQDEVDRPEDDSVATQYALEPAADKAQFHVVVSLATMEKTKQSAREKKTTKKEKVQQRSQALVKNPTSEYISFYCGNLPPGITQETLSFYLAEEGIQAMVNIQKRRNTATSAIHAKLSTKQKAFKKNLMMAAKDVFATVQVKTEEEAKAMLKLNGITMTSPSNRDWGTVLKIVRRLPNSNKFPYKVHISGLHPQITQSDLSKYLERHGLKAGDVVVIQKHKFKKPQKYAFAWFATVPECHKAVDLPKPSLMGRALVIKHSFKQKFKNW